MVSVSIYVDANSADEDQIAIVGILTFICMINTTSERLEARKFFLFYPRVGLQNFCKALLCNLFAGGLFNTRLNDICFIVILLNNKSHLLLFCISSFGI